MDLLSEKCVSDLVKFLIKEFYKGSLNFSLSVEDIKILDRDEQKKLMDATVYSKKLMEFPVNSNFSKLFFKKLLSFLENQVEVYDEIYTFLCSLMANKKVGNFSYRHYIIKNDLTNTITIKESNNLVINGTTGMRTWEAALMLADWMITNGHIFYKKKILELGSGVGFMGIAVAKHCEIKLMTLTDCHEDLLRIMVDNLELNFPNMQTEQQQTSYRKICTDGIKSIGVMALDWDNIDEISADLVPDVIIGSDIVYDPTILKPLCNVMKTFTDRNKTTVIYIANIIRNQDTYRNFLKELDAHQLSYEEIRHGRNAAVEWDLSIEKYLLKINRKP